MGSTFADSDYGDTVESQLTLGTASLLGIFFGLVTVCGIFFGFGYSVGRHKASATSASIAAPTHVVPAPVMAQTPAPSIAALTPTTNPVITQQVLPAANIQLPASAPAALPSSTGIGATSPRLVPLATAPASIASAKKLNAPKTSANLPTVAAASAPVKPVTTAEHAYVEPKLRIAKPSAIQPTLEQPSMRIPLQHVVPGPQFTAQNLPSPYFVWTPPFDVHYKKGFRRGLTQAAASRAPQAAMTGVSHPSGSYTAVLHTSVPHLSPAGPAMTVRVADFSRQDDAEVLVSALRERGFAPSIQSGNEDALYHVQVGPFSRDVAFATRQRLIAKGYNAILK